MTAAVLKFDPVIIGETYRFDADEILEKAKGCDPVTLAIIGSNADGEVWIMGNANSGELLVLMERAKRQIVFGDS